MSIERELRTMEGLFIRGLCESRVVRVVPQEVTGQPMSCERSGGVTLQTGVRWYYMNRG